MPPKKKPSAPAPTAPPPAPTPVKIGLMRRHVSVISEVEDEIEAPLSESMMVVLDDLVGDIVEVVDDVIIEELHEEDDEDDPQPSTSSAVLSTPKGVSNSKRSLFTASTDTLVILPGGRSKAPIWAFFVPDDIEAPNPSGVGTHLQKWAKCQVPLAGGTRLCNKRIKQGDATTSGLNSHLRTQHPAAWAKFKRAKGEKEREAAGAKRAVDECYDDLEGNYIDN